MKLKVALLGAGRIAAYFHAPILRGHSRVEFTVVADSDPARAYLGEGAAFVSDWRLAIARDDVDAVVICLPPALHADAAIAAFAAGKHVYIEKPLALTLEDARRVEAAWRASGKIGVIGFNFRFHPRFREIAKAIAGARLLSGQAVFTSAARTLPGWKATRATGGGALRELGVHHADLIPVITGEPIAGVFAHECDDGLTATVDWRLASGAVVQGAYAISSGDSENSFSLMTDRGHIRADMNDPTAAAMRTPPGRFARLRRLQRDLSAFAPAALAHQPGANPSFKLSLDAFLLAAESGGIGACADIAAGVRSMELVFAAEESAAQCRPAAV